MAAMKRGKVTYETRTPDHVSRAIVVCGGCGMAKIVPVPVSKAEKEKRTDLKADVVRRLNQAGWRADTVSAICDKCTEQNRQAAKKEAKMTSEDGPTKEQKRQIVSLLSDVYDVDAECYCGSETDDSVAQTLGLPPAWVADIRDDLFGPAGANEDMARLHNDLHQIASEAKALMDQIREEVATVRVMHEDFELRQSRRHKQIDDLVKRAGDAQAALDKIVSGLSPRLKAVSGVGK